MNFICYIPLPTINNTQKNFMYSKEIKCISLSKKIVYDSNEHGLNEACKYGNLDAITKILNEKVNPTADSFNAILEYAEKNKYTLNSLNSRHNWYYSEKKKDIISKINDMIRLLCFFGYVITKKNILDLVVFGIEIENPPNEFFVEKNFMNYLTRVCNEQAFFLYGIKGTLDGLKVMIKQTDKYRVPDIKQFIKENEIKPDQECLDLICSKKRDKSLVKLFIDTYKIEPSLDHLLMHQKLPDSLKYIVEVLKKKKKIMVKINR